MSGSYTRWYREGTVKVVNGSKAVEGTETFWLSAGLHAGDIFSVNDTKSYEIDTITDNTHLTLRTVYEESDASTMKYSIIRNFTAATPAENTAQTIALVHDVRRYIDGEQSTLHGKSAYEIAKDNGYIGTEPEWLTTLQGLSAYDVAKAAGYKGTQSEWLESLTAYGQAKASGYKGTLAEWLESLKAAGEWSTLDERTAMIRDAYSKAVLHNQHVRGKNLGTFTPEIAEAISSGEFDDLWLGDYFENVYGAAGVKWMIAGFDYFGYNSGSMEKDADGVWYPKSNTHNVALITDRPVLAVNQENAFYTKEQREQAGSYIDSNYFVNIRPKALEALREFFGADHLFTWGDFSTSFDAKGVRTSGTSYLPGLCEVPTMYMMTGIPDPQLYTAWNKDSWSAGDAEMGEGQLPIFRHAPELLRRKLDGRGEYIYWLRGWVGNGVLAHSIHPYAEGWGGASYYKRTTNGTTSYSDYGYKLICCIK